MIIEQNEEINDSEVVVDVRIISFSEEKKQQTGK